MSDMSDPAAARAWPNGWLVLDKPLALGSTAAVGAVKRALRRAGFARGKVGHGGTLDPLASGVLPIALGEATKLAGRMLDASKEYAFTIAFGTETDTLDAGGAAVATHAHRPTAQDVARVLPAFTGAITQVPPAYSALKVDGERAYDLARAGGDVRLAARAVTVFDLQLMSAAEPGPQSVTLSAHVSKGTYIRSLARDIALALGTRGHVTCLRRTRAGPFGLDRAISLDMLEDIARGASLENAILPLEAGLDDIPALSLDPEQARAVRQGRVLTGLPHDDGLCCAYLGRTPVALVEVRSGTVRVARGFNLPDVAE